MGVRVREKPKGSGVWWVFISHQGRRRSKKVGSEAAALEVAEKVQALITLGEFKIKGKDKKVGAQDVPTFRACAERWLGLPHEWKESTLENYRGIFEKYVYPRMGGWRMDSIRRKDIKDFLDDLLVKRKLSLSTVRLIKAPVSGVFHHAVDAEILEANPAGEITLKDRGKAFEGEPLKEEEAARLLEEAGKYLGGAYYPVLLCALRTGMRSGELQALQWGDLDFNGRFIEVRRSYRRGRVSGTKNKRRRRVDMTPQLAEALRALRVVQKKRALRRGGPVSEWVFATEAGGMFHKETFRNALRRCLEAAGLRRVRVHDLRHSYATIRLLRGHNIGDVSYQLGHSSIKITFDTYGHWLPGKFKGEVDELDGVRPDAPRVHPAGGASGIFQSFQ